MPSKKLTTLAVPVALVIGGLCLLDLAGVALRDAQSSLGILENIGYWGDAKFVSAIGTARAAVLHAKLALAAGILALGAAVLVRFRSACTNAPRECIVDRFSGGRWLAFGLLLLAVGGVAWWQLDLGERAVIAGWVPGLISMANHLGGKFGLLTFLGGTGTLFLFLALLHVQREEQRSIGRRQNDDVNLNTFTFFHG
jgi:hypothetical protein